MKRINLYIILLCLIMVFQINCFADETEEDIIVVSTEQDEYDDHYEEIEIFSLQSIPDLFEELPQETILEYNLEYKYLGDYSLEYLLNHFGIIAFGDVDLSQHCMGNLLVKGNLSGNYNNFADSPYNIEPSYIEGYISKPGGPNGRSKYSNIPIYVGSVNIVDGNSLNGIANYNHQDPIYITNSYIEWGRIYKLAIDEIARIQSANDNRTTITIQWPWQEINIQRGAITNLVTGGSYCKIRLVGESDGNTTVINVLDSGSVINPQVIGLQQGEENPNGEPICITYPNATEVKIPPEMTPEIGCVIAPYADIVITGGNTNGSLLGKNLTTTAEGHMWPYKAIKTQDEKESESESETSTESQTEPITEEFIETESETESEVESETETELESETESETETESESEIESEGKFETETEIIESENESEVITEHETEVATEHQTEKITEKQTEVVNETEQTEKQTNKQTEEQQTEQQTDPKRGGVLGTYDQHEPQDNNDRTKSGGVLGKNRSADKEMIAIPKTGDRSPLLKYVIGLIVGFISIVSLVYALNNRQ